MTRDRRHAITAADHQYWWSWRDLRTHWIKVGAIAIVIAIGTGGYAGLTSTTGRGSSRSTAVSVDICVSPAKGRCPVTIS